MSRAPRELFWPAERLGEAIESAGAQAGSAAESFGPVRGVAPQGESLPSAAARLGFEAQAVDTAYGELEDRLLVSSPAVVSLAHADRREFAVITGSRGRELEILAPDLHVRRIRVEVMLERMCRAIDAPAAPAIDRMLSECGVREAVRPAARRAVLRQQQRSARVEGLFLLRPAPGASLAREFARAGLGRRLFVFLGAHLVQYTLWLVSWWIVGKAALEGRFDPGWFTGWTLLLASLIPFRLLATSTQGAFAVAAGGVLKKKLLDAALRLDPQAVRGQGIGAFVGRVIESEAVESLALSGGILGLTAAIELGIASIVLCLGPGGVSFALALFAWTALTLAAAWACWRRRAAWTQVRLELTQDQVEKMIGHRTRLVQSTRAGLHDGEDAALERYLGVSSRLDAATARLLALVPRGWLLVGIVGCGLEFVRSNASASGLALELGGVLLAHQALLRLAHGLSDLSGAAIAWKQVLPMLRIASDGRMPAAGIGSALVVPPRAASQSGRKGGTGRGVDAPPAKVLQAQDLGYTHPGRSEPVIHGLNLEVYEGDRVLLEGPSGCGKSTLASLLCGLRIPDAGVVLLHGVDQRSMGEVAWRRRIAAAPQFHENHVLSETFALNLLMGGRWPPRAEDLQRAEALCRELGLSGLLERMPAGILEMVGESGWQLSHGERSRLFLARALLQESDVVVLDESFAALDPANLESSLRCALERSKTLVVIAHP